MKFLDLFCPPHRLGLRYSSNAQYWASVHFPQSHQQVAATVAGILCEQTGAEFFELHPNTHFMRDIGVYDFFDAVIYSTAIQQEFGLMIPEYDLDKIERISDLVDYICARVTR
jgi:acyl carrier protein